MVSDRCGRNANSIFSKRMTECIETPSVPLISLAVWRDVQETIFKNLTSKWNKTTTSEVHLFQFDWKQIKRSTVLWFSKEASQKGDLSAAIVWRIGQVRVEWVDLTKAALVFLLTLESLAKLDTWVRKLAASSGHLSTSHSHNVFNAL